jgi:XisH protein
LPQFHTALGQFINYRYALLDFDPGRVLYLAVPVDVYDDFFSQSFIQSVIQRSQVNLLIYDDEKEEVVQWRN